MRAVPRNFSRDFTGERPTRSVVQGVAIDVSICERMGVRLRDRRLPETRPTGDRAETGALGVERTTADVNRIGNLARRIRLGEDSTLELKRVVLAGSRVASPSRDDFADELAAFANTRGGTVILGVDDKTREIQGIPLDSLDLVEGWAREICNDSTKPALDADIYKMELEGSDGLPVPVIRMEIPRSLFVHRSPGGYFRRLGSSKRENGPGGSGAAVSGTQPEPDDPIRRVGGAQHHSRRSGLRADAPVPARRAHWRRRHRGRSAQASHCG